MEIKKLIGKSIIDVILEIPNFNWNFKEGVKETKPKIRKLIFVDYVKKKPREREDLYQHIDIDKLSLETLRKFGLIDYDNEKCIGLTSQVLLGEPYLQEEYKFAHIPMIDFDTDKKFDFLNDEELFDLIKRMIQEKTELNKGLILNSSKKRNYHFIATERLFDKEDFITFCGIVLSIKCKIQNGEWVNLADSRHIGHALSPMKYLHEFSDFEDSSVYDITSRFATLRITSKNNGEFIPKVVDVL